MLRPVFCALRQVYLASASPPVRHANVYGVDMPTRREFVAYNLSEEEICTVRSQQPGFLPVTTACRSFSRAIKRVQ